MEANILLVKCPTAKKMFGIRVQKMKNGDWERTWAFKISEKQAGNEGYDNNTVNGSLNATKEYPGCPYCGTDGFVQCGCGKLSCWNGEDELECLWCGTTMENFVSASEFEVAGGGY